MRIGIIWGILLAAVVVMAPVRLSHAAEQDFLSWLGALRQDALQYGVSQKLIDEALPDTLTPNERVIRLDRQQPEGGIPFEKYKKNVVTAKRLQAGRARMRQYSDLLKEISGVYGVESQYIVALWGIETNFGKHVGGFETVPALVTLAYDGRRGGFFRQELLKALKIIDQGNISLHEMRGSWAGAMGQCQFMPTSFEKFAQDYNKDGKRDIWNTKADVFASAAAYLSGSGWQQGQPWGRRVMLPKGFDRSLIGLSVGKPIQFWQAAGIRLPNGRHLPLDSHDLVSIIQPGGEGYKTFIVYGNYRILMQWNNSTYFATAVGHFADQLK
ncbi:MAG: lytic murein transglycosylase [Alphaproteobacteria bacterium]|nr:lytic murein transglycosylase [Alphaproteobacteria bacterium]